MRGGAGVDSYAPWAIRGRWGGRARGAAWWCGTILRATAETTGAASCRRTRRPGGTPRPGCWAGSSSRRRLLRRPADLGAGAEQENMLLALTAAFSMAAAAVLLIQHSISGRSHELLSGWALAAFSVGHLALVERGVGDGALLSDRAAATYTVTQGLAARLLRRASRPATNRTAGRSPRRRRQHPRVDHPAGAGRDGRLAHRARGVGPPAAGWRDPARCVPRRALARRGRLPRAVVAYDPLPRGATPSPSCSAGADWPSWPRPWPTSRTVTRAGHIWS